jgi:hypothetical protein
LFFLVILFLFCFFAKINFLCSTRGHKFGVSCRDNCLNDFILWLWCICMYFKHFNIVEFSIWYVYNIFFAYILIIFFVFCYIFLGLTFVIYNFEYGAIFWYILLYYLNMFFFLIYIYIYIPNSTENTGHARQSVFSGLPPWPMNPQPFGPEEPRGEQELSCQTRLVKSPTYI